jgi:hypothetical protein
VRPLQEPPVQEPPISAVPRGRGAAAPSRAARCVVGVVGGVLWWGGLLWLVLGPEASAASVRGWVAAGGWGLGLIPLHAVPAYARRPRRRRAQA